MNTFWEYSIHTEAQRLLQICQKIACGFYKINNFIVLPYPAKANPNTVILPILPYLSISLYWDRLKKMPNESIPITPPKYLLRQTKNLLATGNFPHPPASIRHLWSKYQKTIMKTIYQTLPQKQNFVKSLHLWQTNFGTICSFSWEKNPSDIYIWLRSDATLTNIVEAILTSITRHDVYKNLNFTWSESEAVVDWLLTYSPIAQLLKTIDPGYTQGLTLKNTRAFQSGTLIQKSQAFLTRDEIADLIFGSQSETFSLYAVSKSIQRLRDRLEKNGISGSFIQTKRSKGYLLKN